MTANKPLGSLFWLTIALPGWAGARPGQFALLQAEPSRCFLPRAFSIAQEAGEEVSFLVAPVGPGTQELCSLRAGDPVRVLGPLGNGFDLEQMGVGSCPGNARLVIAAGGAGAAPFPFLLSRLEAQERAGRFSCDSLETSQERRERVVVLLGFRDARQAQGSAPITEAVSRLRASGVSVGCMVVTEDGSVGPAGKVTDLLGTVLRPSDRVLACGPSGMPAAVWQRCCAVADVRTWFSMETAMACGVGSCHGCALTMADGSIARVCHDGPVFLGEEVFGPRQADSDSGGTQP